MSAARRIILVGAACLFSACTNGWGSLSKVAEKECGQAHDLLVRQRQAQLDQMRALQEMSQKTFGNTQTAKDYADAHKDLEVFPTPDRQKFMAACAQPLAEALAPCTEHKFGSDSALLCIGRRGNPVVLAAFMKSRAEPDIESAFREAMEDARPRPVVTPTKTSTFDSPNDKPVVEDAGVLGALSASDKDLNGIFGGKPTPVLSDLTTAPTVAKEGALRFPPAAALAGMKEAEVILDITIRADGSVGRIEKLEGDDIFVDAAKDAINTSWEFTAGTRGGVPVESSFELTLLFER